VEISKSLDVWDLRPSAIMLEKIFEIMLNLEIESALLRPTVIIVQFILGPNYVTIES
jgi:hypothetical protein